jgi:hypothetical protein
MCGPALPLLGQPDLIAADVAIAPNGTIVVAATAGDRSKDEQSIWVHRLRADGTRKAAAPFVRGADSAEHASAVAVSVTGDIYVAGFAIDAERNYAVLMKLAL